MTILIFQGDALTVLRARRSIGAVEMPDPIVAAACPTRAAVVRIEADPRVRAMERADWLRS